MRQNANPFRILLFCCIIVSEFGSLIRIMDRGLKPQRKVIQHE